jgi:hypothetical protein
MENMENKEKIELLSDIIKIQITEKNIKEFKMFYKKDSFIIKEKKIGEYKIGEKKFILISPISGRILEIDEDNFKIIIERCKHDQTYINLCVYCGFDIR